MIFSMLQLDRSCSAHGYSAKVKTTSVFVKINLIEGLISVFLIIYILSYYWVQTEIHIVSRINLNTKKYQHEKKFIYLYNNKFHYVSVFCLVKK